MLEKYVNEPVSYLKFTYLYDKLSAETGTTIRLSLKDEKRYTRRISDIVWIIHKPEVKFKAEITKIEMKKIAEISLELLRADVAPIQIQNHRDFLKILQSFYKFPLTLDMNVFIIYWRRLNE